MEILIRTKDEPNGKQSIEAKCDLNNIKASGTIAHSIMLLDKIRETLTAKYYELSPGEKGFFIQKSYPNRHSEDNDPLNKP